MNLLVVTPTYSDLLRSECEQAVRRQRVTGTMDYRIIDHNPHPVPDFRNVLEAYRLVWQMMRAGDYDALVTVEHDIVLPDEMAIQRLYETPGDVVYGAYVLRHGSNVMNLWEKNGIRNLGQSLTFKPELIAEYRRRGFGPVSGVGWGATLIRRHVVERIDLRGRDDGGPTGGDLEFAQDVLRAGLSAVGRFDVACWHIEHGTWLHPYEGVMNGVQVTALQTFNGRAAGGLMRFVKGESYEIDYAAAHDYQRAGLLQIITPPAVEVAAHTPGDETAAVATGKRRRR